MSYFTEIFSPQGQAKRLRDEAARYDELARGAKRDGDLFDAADCQAKATDLRRKARRIEIDLAAQ